MAFIVSIPFLRHQPPSLSTQPTLRGVAKVRTLKLDFMVKSVGIKKNYLGILNSTLYRYQNRKNALGHNDTLRKKVLEMAMLLEKPLRMTPQVSKKYWEYRKYWKMSVRCNIM